LAEIVDALQFIVESVEEIDELHAVMCSVFVRTGERVSELHTIRLDAQLRKGFPLSIRCEEVPGAVDWIAETKVCKELDESVVEDGQWQIRHQVICREDVIETRGRFVIILKVSD
jgi:hypothetical protein